MHMKFEKLYIQNPTADFREMALIAKAMAHPVRLYVLHFLSKQACCYSGDLSEILPIAKSTLSQHLSELKKAGLIQGELETPKIRYCINNIKWEQAKAMFNDFFQAEKIIECSPNDDQ